MFLIDMLKALVWNTRQWEQYHRDWAKVIAKAGANCRLGPGIRISHPERLQVGDGVIIGPGTVINSSAGVTIGSHTGISYDCAIWTGNHRYYDGSKLPFDETSLNDGVSIGECVWMGTRAMIVPGVRVGEGAVIAMGAVVTSDVPPLAIVGGCPARILKMRDEEHYWRLKREKAFFR
jgi:acetyltransferase-like isoleucine patch superfamily enzyme